MKCVVLAMDWMDWSGSKKFAESDRRSSEDFSDYEIRAKIC